MRTLKRLQLVIFASLIIIYAQLSIGYEVRLSSGDNVSKAGLFGKSNIPENYIETFAEANKP